MRMKRLLVIGGIILILTGMILMLWPEPVEEEKSIWERIPDEEIHTYQQEKREAENISELCQGEQTKEGASHYGQDSSSGCSGDEEGYPEGLMTAAEEVEFKDLATAEAGGEGEDGQWLVMSVAMNRKKSSEFPDNIHDVIYQYKVAKGGRKIYQFSCVGDGRIEEVEPTEETEAALERIKRGEIAPEVIAFEVTSSNVLDEWFEYAFTFKNHKFYTLKH